MDWIFEYPQHTMGMVTNLAPGGDGNRVLVGGGVPKKGAGGKGKQNGKQPLDERKLRNDSE